MLKISDKEEKYIQNKKYEYILNKKNIYGKTLDLCLNITQKYIIENNLIIYGGSAIDYALKSIAEKGIYSKDVLPDYDFYSPDSYNDSIELANILHEEHNINGISSINAYHTTTRKVRYNFMEVADISYIPKEIFDNLPCLMYNKMRIIHPHFQRLDMHKSLSNLYTNVPLDSFRHRVKKDIIRFNLLEKNFKIKCDYDFSNSQTTVIVPIHMLKNKCITGLLAFCIFNNIYTDFNNIKTVENKLSSKFKIDSDKNNIIITIPKECEIMKISLLSYDFINDSNKLFDKNKIKCYNRFLDDIKPKSVVCDNYELLDSHNTMISAKNICDISIMQKLDWIKNIKKSDNIYIPTSHNVLQYFLCEYFLLKFRGDKNFKMFLSLYVSTLKMTKYFNETLLEPFIIMSNYYGKYDINYQYKILNERYKAELSDDSTSLKELNVLLPPFGYYPENNKIPEKFNYESWVFEINNKEFDCKKNK